MEGHAQLTYNKRNKFSTLSARPNEAELTICMLHSQVTPHTKWHSRLAGPSQSACMHCVTQAPHPLLCPNLDKWPPRDDDGPPRIGLSEDGTGVRLPNYKCFNRELPYVPYVYDEQMRQLDRNPFSTNQCH